MIDTQSIRCSILKLAFSGKLTDQLNSDEDVDSLLAQINKDGTIRKLESGPYEIPESWAWVRLGDLYTINPKVSADDEVEAAFIPMERISAGFERDFTYETQNWGKASKNHTRFADGDIAFAKITPCFENRKSFIAEGLPNGIGGGTTELIILRQPDILPEYTYYLLLDQRFISEGVGSYKGSVGQQRVQMDVIKDYPIPLAPYSEQVRIIDKIKQAFSVLDMIDSMQADYSNNMIVLKSKLIDLAIQGKLTEQLPEDGTAEELYQQIQAEKQDLIKNGKIKKEKPLPEIKEEEIPFKIPANWKWVSLGNIISLVSGTDFKPEQYNDSGLGCPYMTGASNIVKDHLIINRWTTEPKNIAYERDLLLVCKGSGFGKLVICDVPEVHIARQFMAIRPSGGLNINYIKYVMENSMQTIRNAGKGLIPGVDRETVLSLKVPLPPLPEQLRIVAKLNELLTAEF